MSTPASPERVWRALLGAFALCTPLLAAAAEPAAADPAVERERIAAERAAAQVRYRQAMDACTALIAITACQDRARADRRQALERLDADQAALDERQRRERADARRAAIEQRRAARDLAPAASAAERGAPAPTSSTPLFPARPEPAADRASAAARHEADALARYRERQQRAQAHQLEVQRRNAEQDARHPPAAGLPVPAASAGASR